MSIESDFGLCIAFEHQIFYILHMLRKNNSGECSGLHLCGSVFSSPKRTKLEV